MSDLFDDDEPGAGGNAPTVTISELSGAVKRAIEGGFGHVRVRAEVGRVSRPRSGHVYLDLKDDRAVLASIIWKGVASKLRTQPEEGMEVIVTGKLTTFAGQSRYQMVIESLAPAGVGALMAMLEKRRNALAAEGLFDAERKRALPFLPKVIGVITSPSGAVIRDILHRLRDRFPREVLVWPVSVQGERCAAEVAAAIRGFNNLAPDGPIPRPDLLIVARGGGSLEDLWGFNEEIVVRAAADSQIPLISAVGHETDTTLIDFASDRRAPTPTAAAEIAVPVRAELRATLAALDERRIAGMARILRDRGDRVRAAARALPRAQTLVSDPRQRLDRAGDRLPTALGRMADRKRLALTQVAFDPARLIARLAEPRAKLRNMSLGRAILKGLSDRQDRLKRAQLRPAGLIRMAEERRSLTSQQAQRLHRAGARILPDRARAVTSLGRTLETLSYHEVLNRGFAVVRRGDELIKNPDTLSAGDALSITFADHKTTTARVEGQAASKPRPAAKPRTSSTDGGQGSLF